MGSQRIRHDWVTFTQSDLGSKITEDGDCSHEIKRCVLLGKKAVTNLDSILKSRDITLPTKVHLVKAMVFPVVMYGCELDHKEGWAPKNWCFWTVVLETTLESPLDCKEIKSVNPKGNQPWIFTGRIHAESEAPILWPPDAKNWLIGKYLDAEKDWKWKKGTTENEMVRKHSNSMNINLSKLQEIVKDWEAWHVAVHGVGYNLMTEQQQQHINILLVGI